MKENIFKAKEPKRLREPEEPTKQMSEKLLDLLEDMEAWSKTAEIAFRQENWKDALKSVSYLKADVEQMLNVIEGEEETDA